MLLLTTLLTATSEKPQHKITMQGLRKTLPGDYLTPRSMAVIGCWSTALTTLLGYFVILPFALEAGMAPLEFAALYLSQGLVALSPVLTILIGQWLFYWYLYAICIPICESIALGKTQARLVFYAVDSLMEEADQNPRAWWFNLGGLWAHPIAYFRTNLLRLSIPKGIPSHLAHGWSSGVNPQIVYG